MNNVKAKVTMQIILMFHRASQPDHRHLFMTAVHVPANMIGKTDAGLLIDHIGGIDPRLLQLGDLVLIAHGCGNLTLVAACL